MRNRRGNVARPALWLAGLCFPMLAPGCGEVGGAGLARPAIDTLPGGVVRVSNEAPTAWREGRGWQLSEELRITGEAGKVSELIDPVSLAVDQRGRIWVVDQKPAVIKVYEPDGRFIRTVGRHGAGPGEFRVGFLAAGAGAMVLHDPMTSRTSVFDTSGGYLRSWHSHCCYWSSIYVDRQQRIYIPGPWAGEAPSPGTPYYRYTIEGQPLDTVFVPSRDDEKSWVVRSGAGANRIMMGTTVPFTPATWSAFDPEGGFVYGWSGAYELTVTRTGRDSALLFGRAWTPEPITDAMRRDTVEALVRSWDMVEEAVLRATFKLDEVPASRPAFEGIGVSTDGDRWVRVGPDGSGGIRFDVFDPAGGWRGTVLSPIAFSHFRGVGIGPSGMVVMTEGADGRPAVVRLRIDKGPA